MQDAVELKTPDRVPFSLFAHYWAATNGGITYKQAMYEHDLMMQVTKDAVRLVRPDDYGPPVNISLGPTMELMDFRQIEWPGHGVPDDVAFQYLDREYMTAEEYDDYIFDPTGFFLHTYMPRLAGAFEVFAKLPDFATHYQSKFVHSMAAFGDPEVIAGYEKLFAAGKEMASTFGKMGALMAELAAEGYPVHMGGRSGAPFDHFADYLRGSKGAMLDMFRNGDKLLEAMEKASVLLLRDPISTCKATGAKHLFIPLHWGLDGFMSPDQFNTFYWPQLRKMIIEIIDQDLTPCVFWEGNCTSRLDQIGDIPKGKAIYWFEQTDLFDAKAALGDIVCLRGNVPASMLATGTPEEVDAFCKKIIQGVGKDGGLILDGSVGTPDESKTENVVAMAEATRKYSNGG
jgi:hypothetical protein